MSDKQIKQPRLYVCAYCNYTVNSSIIFERHCNSSSHIAILNATSNEEKINDEEETNTKQYTPINKEKVSYKCELCNFITNKKFNYTAHLLTTKHRQKTEEDFKKVKRPNKIYRCENCNSEYNIYQSYWKHKKSCIVKGSQQPEYELVEENTVCRPPSSASAEVDEYEESDTESENFVYLIDDITGDEYCYEYKYIEQTEYQTIERIQTHSNKNYYIYSETDTDTESNIDTTEEKMEEKLKQEPNKESIQIVLEVLDDLLNHIMDNVTKLENEKNKQKEQNMKNTQNTQYEYCELPDEVCISDVEFSESEYSEDEY